MAPREGPLPDGVSLLNLILVRCTVPAYFHPWSYLTISKACMLSAPVSINIPGTNTFIQYIWKCKTNFYTFNEIRFHYSTNPAAICPGGCLSSFLIKFLMWSKFSTLNFLFCIDTVPAAYLPLISHIVNNLPVVLMRTMLRLFSPDTSRATSVIFYCEKKIIFYAQLRSRISLHWIQMQSHLHAPRDIM